MEIFIIIQLIVFNISFRHKLLRNLTHYYFLARILKNNLRKIVSDKKQKRIILNWKVKQSWTKTIWTKYNRFYLPKPQSNESRLQKTKLPNLNVFAWRENTKKTWIFLIRRKAVFYALSSLTFTRKRSMLQTIRKLSNMISLYIFPKVLLSLYYFFLKLILHAVIFLKIIPANSRITCSFQLAK